MDRYDLIGDIHGHHDTLVALLDKLGYRNFAGAYWHPSRKVIFLGDFVDRGPLQRKVIEAVCAMLDSGSALAVMGNHEFNAIAYATRDPDTGEYLRPHSEKNLRQHEAFLAEYPLGSAEHARAIGWMKTLPLWLDLGSLRVIHACWDAASIQRLGAPTLSDGLLIAASRKGAWEYTAIETLLKGKEIPLGEGHGFRDKDGTVRHNIRVRWWDPAVSTYREAFMGPESSRTHIPEDEIAGDHLVDYGKTEPPLFVGHYWLEGRPEPLSANIACLDYSVAKSGGRLVAYRWDGERELDGTKFVSVDRAERRG